MASQPDVNPDCPPTTRNDPVDQLKLSVSKLAEGIQKMGDVLGASKQSRPSVEKSFAKGFTPTDGSNNVCFSGVRIVQKGSQPYTLSNHTDKSNSAEEIKAQRANKAAEKKARAQVAAAKKAAAGDQSTTQDKMNKPKQKREGSGHSEDAQLTDDHVSVKISPVGKSALRCDGKPPPAREVKFDLNTTTVKTPSEESVCSEVPLGHCSECPEPPTTAHIHPAFLDLVVRCEQDMIDDVDSLCLSFITAFREYLTDWAALRQKENRDPSSLSHDLDMAIRPQIAHLTQESRFPLPYALGNIVRQLKKEIMKMGKRSQNGRVQSVEDVTKWLNDCEEEYFGSAYRAISDCLLGKMRSASSVVTYDWCPLVNKVLLDSVGKGFNSIFTVIDSEMEGRGMRHIKSFLQRKIRCRYTDLNSAGGVVKSGSMVLLGCTAVLSNGCVVAPRGSMLIALTAKAFNIPVLIVSQTFKFVDKVQGGSRVALLGRESVELVPSDLITAIVTEIRVLPPSSAPAVLKAKALDLE